MSFLSFKNTNHNNLSDAELISLYKMEQHFKYIETLYERYMGHIYGLALKYVKDVPLAKDLVLEIYAELPAKIKKYDIDNFKSWLYKVAKNHVLNYLRKEKRRNEKDNVAKDMYFEENVHPISDDEIFEKKMSALELCLSQLNPNQKTCVDMFYYKKMSYVEIVTKTGMALGKVRSLLQNGRRNLKICINQQNG